jgi:hypothetical protein
VLFLEDVLDRSRWYCFGTYAIHLKVGTWRKHEGLVCRVLHRNWEAWRRRTLLKNSLNRGSKLSHGR